MSVCERVYLNRSCSTLERALIWRRGRFRLAQDQSLTTSAQKHMAFIRTVPESHSQSKVPSLNSLFLSPCIHASRLSPAVQKKTSCGPITTDMLTPSIQGVLLYDRRLGTQFTSARWVGGDRGKPWVSHDRPMVRSLCCVTIVEKAATPEARSSRQC